MTSIPRAGTNLPRVSTSRTTESASLPQGGSPGARNTVATAHTQDAFEARALRYDGRTPAAGTTNTRAWIPVDAPVRGDPSNRNAAAYNEVLNQFAVGHNPRYTPREGNTYCNIFMWDATRAMGAEIPHWVDRNGNSTGVGKGRELNANATVDWLHQHGARHGWRQVSAEDAQRLANQGHPAVASWKNPRGIGHVGMVRPGELTSRGPAMAQAGSRNFNQGHVKDGFGNRPVQYWVNDSGRATGSPSTPAPSTPPSRPTPSTPPSPAPGASHPSLPSVNLERGKQGPQVKQLQDALVKLGYMTPAQVATGPGIFGPKTQAAVAKFQTDRGITPNSGTYGPKTRAAMSQELAKLDRPATPPPASNVSVPQSNMRSGSKGPQVKQLQDALVKLGYMTRAQVATGPGIFGPKTQAAVAKFQTDHGIQPNSGIYGPKTRAALTQALNG